MLMNNISIQQYFPVRNFRLNFNFVSFLIQNNTYKVLQDTITFQFQQHLKAVCNTYPKVSAYNTALAL